MLEIFIHSAIISNNKTWKNADIVKISPRDRGTYPELIASHQSLQAWQVSWSSRKSICPSWVQTLSKAHVDSWARYFTLIALYWLVPVTDSSVVFTIKLHV